MVSFLALVAADAVVDIPSGLLLYTWLYHRETGRWIWHKPDPYKAWINKDGGGFEWRGNVFDVLGKMLDKYIGEKHE